MKKLLTLLIMLIFCISGVQAKAINKSANFNSVLKDFDINKNSISISIRDLKSGRIVYSLNDTSLMNPASVQKILTMPAAFDILGEDYKFSTELYPSGEGAYTIKLSGDPYLRAADLKALVAPTKIDTKDIYLDATILDDKTWGEGWQWDDDMNTLMPRFGAYNIDRNLIKITLIPNDNGKCAQIVNPSKYPLVFYNNVTTSNKTSLDIKRDNSSPNTIILSGTVARPTIIYIPVINIKQYFELQLKLALENHKVYMKNQFKMGSGKISGEKESSVEHDINFALQDILKNSNNLAAETVFKIAGGKYKGTTGTDKAGIEMFNAFCEKLEIDTSDIKITDGSGVSKNNLVSSDFVSEYLYEIQDSKIVDYMAAPGEGTLTQRLIPVRDNLKAKTGTLSGISSIAGYLTTRKGRKYAFCIIQNDVKLSPADKKMLEDGIIKEMYLKL